MESVTIEDHFDVSYELEDTLVERISDLLEAVQKISGLAKFFSMLRQPIPLGDGHALFQAAHLVDDDESVLVIFGDCIMTVLCRHLASLWKRTLNIRLQL